MKFTATAIVSLLQALPAARAGLGSLDSLPVITDDLIDTSAIELVTGEACLIHRGFTISVETCSYEYLAEAIEQLIPLECPHAEGTTELNIVYGSEQSARDAVASNCKSAWKDHAAAKTYKWEDVTGYGAEWDKEFYDGNTNWNESYESIYDAIDPDSPGNVLKIDAARIRSLYDGEARYYPIEVPDHLDNFDDCNLRSMMCCWTADRQANDNNGNCKTPYDTNCVNADPGDNTDLCAVDMERAGHSNHVDGGFATFEGDNNGGEGAIHCHGLAWGADEMETDARYRANNLFFVSMYDHMYQRGYVRNVPGAPMCGCVEKMPIVSRSDCTEMAVEEQWLFTWDTDTADFVTEFEKAKITFNACQGTFANNNLEAFYHRLAEEDRVTHEEFYKFKETVVGDNKCNNAIKKTITDAGFEYRPSAASTTNTDYAYGYADLASVAVSGDGAHTFGLTEDSVLLKHDADSNEFVSTDDNGKRFKQMSVDFEGTLYAITRDDELMVRTEDDSGIEWTMHDRRPLSMISVSGDGKHLWGINKDYDIFYKTASDEFFTQVDGDGTSLKQVSANHDGSVIAGLNVNNQVYYRTTEKQSWTKVSGTLDYIEAYGDGTKIFGVQNDGDVYYTDDITQNKPTYTMLPGSLKTLSVTKEGKGLWGVDKHGFTYYRPGKNGIHGENFALSGSASQSSTIHGGSASRAIDGNRSGHWHHGSVTHSNHETAWWKVDLAKDIKVTRVVIHNRTDCCGERLGQSGSTLELLDAGGTVVASQAIGSWNDYKSNPSRTFYFDNVQAKSVRVKFTSKNYLMLAEIEVNGEEA